MEASDVGYLVILVVTVGMIFYGALIPSVGLLLWLGIILTVIFAVVWITLLVRRQRSKP